MPTNPTLPTYEQILERVKAQDWGHEFLQWSPDYVAYYCECGKIKGDVGDDTECPVRIAQAIQAAMVETLRTMYEFYDLRGLRLDYMGEAAAALEKSLKT